MAFLWGDGKRDSGTRPARFDSALEAAFLHLRREPANAPLARSSPGG